MRQLKAEALGEELATHFLDPDTCREIAELLRDQPRPDPVGCCEVAFARAAVLRFVVEDTQPASISARVRSGIEAVVTHMFNGPQSAQTGAWYGAEDLSITATKAIEHYRPAAFWSDRIAKTMADRLGLGRPSSALANTFSRLTEDAVVWIMKVKIL